MGDMELLLLIGSVIASIAGWKNWYLCLFNMWPPDRGRKHRIWLGLLPVICTFLILYVLKNLASFDVVGDAGYLFFYVILGIAWIAGGRELMFILFDISWRDDAIERNNTAAVLSVSGGLIGITVMYAGANIGDGPGWWCVIFAGGLAVGTWFILTGLIQVFSNVFEKITVERDTATGLRIGMYMMSSALVLGRGAAGDWTSEYQTIIEFLDAWPVLGLTFIAILVEKWYNRQDMRELDSGSWIFGAILWGVIYLGIAIGILLLFPPLPENPFYGFLKLSIGRGI